MSGSGKAPGIGDPEIGWEEEVEEKMKPDRVRIPAGGGGGVRGSREREKGSGDSDVRSREEEEGGAVILR